MFRSSNILIALFLVLLFSFQGCVPEGKVTPRVLEGKWTSTKFNGYPNTDITWEFLEDGTFKYAYFSSRGQGSYEWNDDKDELRTAHDWGTAVLVMTNFRVEILDETTLKGVASGPGVAEVWEFERE